MDYILHTLIRSSVNAMMVLGLNYIAGYTGIMSFSQITFYGIGAYTTAIMMTRYGYSFLAALLISILVGIIFAIIASILILRLKDDSLILVSVGFTIIMYNLMLNVSSITNGPLGIKAIPSINIFGINFFDRFNFFILCLIFLIITALIFKKIVTSPYGTVIKGIRENKEVTENMGHNSSFYMHAVFVLGSVFACVGGTLTAPYMSYIEPSLFNLVPSIIVMIMVIFGGFGSMRGAILASFILTIFPEFLRFIGLPDSILAETQQILYGALLFGLMYFRPKGLMGEYRI